MKIKDLIIIIFIGLCTYLLITTTGKKEHNDNIAIYNQLTTPSLSITDNVLSWNEVPNATKYAVYSGNNGALKEGETTTTTYTITTTAPGHHRFYVMAIGNAIYNSSELSNEVVYDIYTELTAPVLTLGVDEISWEPVPNANLYSVYINDEFMCDGNDTGYDLGHFYDIGTYNIKVKCKAYDYYRESSFSNVITYSIEQVTLPTPSLVIDGSVISFRKITNNALKFGILIDGTYDRSLGLADPDEDGIITYDLTNLPSYAEKLATPGTHNIKIRFEKNGNYLRSAESNTVNYVVMGTLSAPQITLNDNIVTWPAVTGCTEYQVYIDDELYAETLNEFEIPATLTGNENCLYEIKVKCKGNANYYESPFSNIVIYSNGVLETPSAILEVLNSNVNMGWTEPDDAVKYEVYKNNTFLCETEDAYLSLDDYLIEGNQDFQVRAVSNSNTYSKFDNIHIDGKNYDILDCNYSYRNFQWKYSIKTRSINDRCRVITNLYMKDSDDNDYTRMYFGAYDINYTSSDHIITFTINDNYQNISSGYVDCKVVIDECIIQLNQQSKNYIVYKEYLHEDCLYKLSTPSISYNNSTSYVTFRHNSSKSLTRVKLKFVNSDYYQGETQGYKEFNQLSPNIGEEFDLSNNVFQIKNNGTKTYFLYKENYEYLPSSFGNYIQVDFAPAPVITLTDNRISWIPDTNTASSYVIYCNGNEVSSGISSYLIPLSELDPGEYVYKIYAIGINKIIDSDFSNEVTYTVPIPDTGGSN